MCVTKRTIHRKLYYNHADLIYSLKTRTKVTLHANKNAMGGGGEKVNWISQLSTGGGGGVKKWMGSVSFRWKMCIPKSFQDRKNTVNIILHLKITDFCFKEAYLKQKNWKKSLTLFKSKNQRKLVFRWLITLWNNF